MTEAPDFLRARDIVQLTGISLRTARRWIARRDPAVREAAWRATRCQKGTGTSAVAGGEGLVGFGRGNLTIISKWHLSGEHQARKRTMSYMIGCPNVTN